MNMSNEGYDQPGLEFTVLKIFITRDRYGNS